MRLFNFILRQIVRFMPAGMTDRMINAFLPESERSLKMLYRLDPRILQIISERKLLSVFRKASAKVPAYRDFLERRNINVNKIRTIRQFKEIIPVTTKENYIQRYPIAERCLAGQFPLRGCIEESSGSSGISTYWIKSSGEEKDYQVLIRTAFHHLYDFGKNERVIVLNGFMSGGWTGNLRFENRIGALGISRNTGPDAGKIIRCLKEFGPGFTYLIGGYPPFILSLIEYGNNQENFRWKDFSVHIYTSGEGFPEEWREFVASELKTGALICSGYGAIDLDVGVSAETPFTIALRKLIRQDKQLRRELLKTDRLPCFAGQFPPHNFHISESISKDGKREPVISVLNLNSASPKLKYVVGDEGGIVTLEEVFAILEKNGHSVKRIMDEYRIKGILPFPLIFIYGRSDGTVSVNGAMIYPSEVNSVILSDPELASVVNTFKLSVEPDESNNIRLHIFLEIKEKVDITESLVMLCSRTITSGLIANNECFRKSVLRNPETGSPVFRIFPFRTALFGKKEDQIKEKYLLS